MNLPATVLVLVNAMILFAIPVPVLLQQVLMEPPVMEVMELVKVASVCIVVIIYANQVKMLTTVHQTVALLPVLHQQAPHHQQVDNVVHVQQAHQHLLVTQMHYLAAAVKIV